MLTYSFTDTGSVSLYEHLYNCIKNDVITGILTPGYKLPSKRTFAKNLGISTITVENAYAQLIAEGYIYSIPKKGYFVSDLKAIPIKQSIENEPTTRNEKAPISGLIADFTSNQTVYEQFPFSIWAKLTRELLNENQSALVTNPPSGGILPLRTAIAKHLKDFRGMEVSPEQIIIGAGTEYLYELIIKLLGFDKRYAVENPGYSKISKIYKANNVSTFYAPMDHNGVIIPALEANNIDVVHISPSHHFPSGIVTPIGRRYELLGWASKSPSRYIIEDDYDSEFRLSGQPIPSLQSIDIMEKVIYINTFTKTLASTVRISYMVLPKQLLKEFYTKLSFYSCTVSNFEQYVLARFIQEGYFEKHLNRMRNYYHTKRDTILNAIKKSPLADYVEISEEDAGLHFLLSLSTSLSDMDVCQKLETRGIKISSLSGYYVEPPMDCEHVFIINYSSIDTANIKQITDIIYEVIR